MPFFIDDVQAAVKRHMRRALAQLTQFHSQYAHEPQVIVDTAREPSAVISVAGTPLVSPTAAAAAFPPPAPTDASSSREPSVNA
jgi:hypothetical protein